MTRLGFDINEGIHPIVPILFRKFENDAQLSQLMARDLYAEGIYVVGFFFPVVPRGQSRIRVQISAAHTPRAHRKSRRRLRQGGPPARRYLRILLERADRPGRAAKSFLKITRIML